MQAVNATIEVEAKGVISTFSPLTDPIFSRGENQMASKNISKLCSISMCERKVKAKSYCDVHYKRLWRFGDPLFCKQNMGTGHTFEERFWSRVNKEGAWHPTDPGLGRCWEWLGAPRHSFGYGMVAFEGREELVHRVSWTLHTGQKPTLFILHSCDNPPCVNPAHLREGTKKDNAGDALQRHRWPIGSNRRGAKITEEIARKVKLLLRNGLNPTEAAQHLNISKSIAYGIRKGRTWKHVTI